MPTVGLPSYQDVNNLYTKYLGRNASQDEYGNWTSGKYGATDLSGIEGQIQNSGEAQTYKQRQAGGPPPTEGMPGWTPPPQTPPSYVPQYPEYPIPGQPSPSPTTSSAPFSYDQINALYQKYLKRGASQDEYQGWATGAYGPPNLGSIEAQIAGSEEAKRAGGPVYTPPPPTGQNGAGPSSADLAQSMLQRLNAGGQTMSAKDIVDEFNRAYPQAQALYYNDYRGETIGFPDGYLAKTPSGWTWTVRGPEGPGPTGGPPQNAPYGGTNVFNDPATAQFEALLNSLINRFNTNATPPGYQQAIDQMNAYLARLNGPVYTPAQMDLMQTQAWDPMQQQHDAARQQLIQRLGSQGISPSSGIFEKALEDLDRQFQQAHTQTQANFSNQAIGLDRQNAATAAQLAPQISNFQQAQTSWQDQRSLQAEVLAALIPQMAQQRLLAASGQVSQLNPLALLNSLGSFQQQGYNQGANYGSAIMQLLAQLFGLGAQ